MQQNKPTSLLPKRKVKPGSLIGFALYQSQNKTYLNAREREAAKRRRRKERVEQSLDYYFQIGDWTPEDEMPEPDETSLSELEFYKVFIAGWEAFRKRCLEEITTYSSSWMKNGPSFAVAEAIKKRLESIPIPIMSESK